MAVDLFFRIRDRLKNGPMNLPVGSSASSNRTEEQLDKLAATLSHGIMVNRIAEQLNFIDCRLQDLTEKLGNG